MNEIVIEQRAFASPEEVHAFLKDALRLPDYYGANLAALNDCLGDVDTPTRIVVERGGAPQLDDWFEKLCSVVGRQALESPAIEAVIRYGR